MRVVLDAPAGAHDFEERLGRDRAIGQEAANLVLGRLVDVAPPIVDAADFGNVGEAVWLPEPRGGRADDLKVLAAPMRPDTSLGLL